MAGKVGSVDISSSRTISVIGGAMVIVSFFLPWSTSINLIDDGTVRGGYTIENVDLLGFLLNNYALGWILGILLVGGVLLMFIEDRGRTVILGSALAIVIITLNQHYLFTGSGPYPDHTWDLRYGMVVLMIGATAASNDLFLKARDFIKTDK